MRKRIILFALAGVVAVCGLFFLTFGRVNRSHFSKKDFKYWDCQASREYAEHDFMDEMNMRTVSAYITYAVSAVGYNYPKEIELPIDLTYYTRSGDKLVEAFTLKKGTMIQNPAERFLRFSSFPTRKKGIRYDIPYTVVGEEPTEDYYYVYLKDLEEIVTYVCLDYTKNNKMTTDVPLSKAVFEATRFVDKMLYDRGIYCSLD